MKRVLFSLCMMLAASVACADATVAATAAAVKVEKILAILNVVISGVLGKWLVDHLKTWLNAFLGKFKMELNPTTVRILAVVVAYPVVLLLNKLTGTQLNPDDAVTFIEALLAGGTAIAVYHTQPQVNQ